MGCKQGKQGITPGWDEQGQPVVGWDLKRKEDGSGVEIFLLKVQKGSTEGRVIFLK